MLVDIPLCLSLLAFAHQVLAASAFSRDHRSYSYSIDRSPTGQELFIRFDPFLQSVDEAVTEMCDSYLNCNIESKELFVKGLTAEYAREVNENIVAIYKHLVFSGTRTGRTHAQSRYEWLDQADTATREEEGKVSSSSLLLWENLRRKTTGKNSTTDVFQAVQQAAASLEVPDLLRARSSPEDLLEAAYQLFNRKHYEHSLVIATYLFFQQPEWREFPPLHSSWRDTCQLGVETKLILYSLLGELFQINNNCQGVTAFYAKTLILLSSQVVYSVDKDGRAAGAPVRGSDSLSAHIARVRVVLFMPTLPSTFEEALAHRARMAEDVEALIAYIATRAVSVPIQDFVNKVSATFFRLPHQGLNDLAINTAVTRLYAGLCPDFSFTAPHLRQSPRARPPAAPLLDFTRAGLLATLPPKDPQKQKFRVAFVSSHFFHHSIGRMLVEMVHFMVRGAATSNAGLLRQGLGGGGGGFEVLAFFMVGPSQQFDDELTAAYEDLLGANFIRIPRDDIERMREVIGSAEPHLDAIVFTDVGMDMQSVILANSRLAPIQIAWWGHPVTTASAAVDYYLGLDVEAPHAGPEHYTEQLVRMEWMNTAPMSPLSQSSRKELAKVSSTSYGIPENSKHFMILGRLFKIHPLFDDALFDILMNTEPSVYIVVVREKNNVELNAELYRRWKEKQDVICCEASDAVDSAHSCCGRGSRYRDYYHAQHALTLNRSASQGSGSGSGPGSGEKEGGRFSDRSFVLHRLRFVHYSSYVTALMAATAVLDTFPYGGCLTSHDAFSNAIPMVTLPLEHVRGRYSVGMYRQMQHGDLVARDQATFTRLAVRLARDDDFRESQSRAMADKYRDLHRNDLVAAEWLQFLERAIKQQVG